MTPIFPNSFSVSWSTHFLYLNCSCFTCSDYTEGSGSSTLVIFENFCFLHFFFSISNSNSTSFFLKLVISPVISEVLLYFWCRNHKWWVSLTSTKCLYKLPGILCYNSSYLMILVNFGKFIHFLPIFPTC